MMSASEELEADREELISVIDKINKKTGSGYKVVTSEEYEMIKSYTLKQRSGKPRSSFGNFTRSVSQVPI